jgi:hypothetical protein
MATQLWGGAFAPRAKLPLGASSAARPAPTVYDLAQPYSIR